MEKTTSPNHMLCTRDSDLCAYIGWKLRDEKRYANDNKRAGMSILILDKQTLRQKKKKKKTVNETNNSTHND